MIVVASDGVLDNLFDHDILNCIRKSYTPHSTQSPQEKETSSPPYAQASNCIARTAETKSFQRDYDSPFAQNARLAGRNHPGGKKDDITVVVGEV